jgi:hypothetical protein
LIDEQDASSPGLVFEAVEPRGVADCDTGDGIVLADASRQKIDEVRRDGFFRLGRVGLVRR